MLLVIWIYLGDLVRRRSLISGHACCRLHLLHGLQPWTLLWLKWCVVVYWYCTLSYWIFDVVCGVQGSGALLGFGLSSIGLQRGSVTHNPPGY